MSFVCMCGGNVICLFEAFRILFWSGAGIVVYVAGVVEYVVRWLVHAGSPSRASRHVM